MPHFGKKSLEQLATCESEIQIICNEAIKIMDFSVICGNRKKEDQDKAHEEGYSEVEWPNSRHNTFPSKAVDILPYPSGWQDIGKFHELAGVIKTIAHQKDIKIRWGGNFKSFFDGAHFELIQQLTKD